LKQKLWVLNLALVAVVVYAGVQFRQRWQAAKARGQATLGVTLNPLPPPPFSAMPAPPPLTAGNYAAVAMRTLFDPSRNPNVVVEAPPPPPPPVMPPLPVCYGVMDLGDGAAAMLSETPTAAHQFLHAGANIGQFHVLDVNTEEIVFEWNGKEIRKRVLDLAQGAPAAQPPAQQAQAEAPPAAPPPPKLEGPGEDLGGFRRCDMKDGQPDGAVQQGFRKVVYSMPFGQACRWEAIR